MTLLPKDDFISWFHPSMKPAKDGEGCTPNNELVGNIQCLLVKNSKRSKMTVLSALIWEGQWNLALCRLKSNQFRYEARQEIELPFGNSDGLPLHLACVMRPWPPAAFLRILLGSYPEACRIRQKSWGLLPLHLASDLGNHQMTGALESTLIQTNGIYRKEKMEELPKLVLLSSGSSES